MFGLQSRYLDVGQKRQHNFITNFYTLHVVVLLVSSFSTSANAILACGLPRGFQGDLQLYSKCGREKTKVIKIQKPDSKNYLVAPSLDVSEPDCIDWFSISQKNRPYNLLGYVKGKDANIVCGGGF